MNRDAIFKLIVLMVMVSIVAALVMGIFQPEGFLTFTGFIGSSFISITGFAVLMFNLVKVKEQTNGNLEKRDALIKEKHDENVQLAIENARLAAELNKKESA
jgi:hypothetical protein